MGNRTLRISALYLLNSSLLITHEIDSAFWKEWDLFGLPGGVQVFLILNFFLIVMVMYGYKQVLLHTRALKTSSLLLASAGILTFFIHTYFVLRGHREFLLPISVGVLFLIVVVSIVQVVVTIRMREG